MADMVSSGAAERKRRVWGRMGRWMVRVIAVRRGSDWSLYMVKIGDVGEEEGW